MIASLHVANLHNTRAPLVLARHRPGLLEGLRWASATMVAPLDGRLLPRPDLSRLGLIAFWDDERALDAFLASHPLAARLASGWHVRMRPLRAVGSWTALPDLPTATPAENTGPTPAESTGQPVAAITLGRLRLRRLSRFLQANAPAAGQAAVEPGLVLAHGLAALPRLVATFSLWETLPR